MRSVPGETRNLIADGSPAREVERHRGLLKQSMEATRDAFGKATAAAKSKKRKSPAGVAPKNKSGRQKKAATN